MPQPRKPVIGITSANRTTKNGTVSHELKQEYSAAILRAGGIPVVLPLGIQTKEDIAALVAGMDGVLLSGGGDLDPQCYGGEQSGLSHNINPQRDTFEFALLLELIAQTKPFLAICRGCQVLNVAMGGDLFQDIARQQPEAKKHDYFTGMHAPDKLVHAVQATPGSLLASLVGIESIRINSRHHQAIARLGLRLTVSARAEDDIVEAIELDKYPFGLGVQWHPESLVDSQSMHKLFGGFIAAARGQ